MAVSKTKRTEEKYLQDCKYTATRDLYMKLRKYAFEGLLETETAATSYYISWGVIGGNQFANISILKNSLCIVTRPPMKKHSIGNFVPDEYQWTLNYRIYISSEEDFDEMKSIIRESYDKVILNRK